MEIQKVLGEIEEAISERDLFEVPDSIIDTDEDTCIVVSGWWVFIPTLAMYLREGVVCVYDEEEKEYLSDFAVTVMMQGELVEDGWIYYEQDGFVISLANYLQVKMRIDELESLECVLCIPEMEADD